MRMNNNLIKLGSLELTPDAFLVLVAGLVLFFVLLMNYGNNLIFYYILLNYIIGAYKINCMIEGNCNLFGRLSAVFTFIAIGITILNIKNINLEQPYELFYQI
jgi:hypothetical protein